MELGRFAAYAQEQAGRDRAGENGSAAIAQKWQRDTGKRDDADHTPDDDERLDRERDRQTAGQQLKKSSGGIYRNSQAAQHEERIEQEHGSCSCEAKLLYDGRINEVRVYRWNIGGEAHANSRSRHSPRSHREQSLN